MITSTKRFNLRAITVDDLIDLFELDSGPLVHKYLGEKSVDNIKRWEWK